MLQHPDNKEGAENDGHENDGTSVQE